jgi:trans-2,3-dihydro-3-hydroxyanthranilate isomerase
MNPIRRHFLKLGALASVNPAALAWAAPARLRRAGQFPFVQVDVFTANRLEGNPLAVFTDARGLSDAEMQQLARETNLQETTFVIPRDAAVEREQGIKVRIFVPTEESPFGGHPTLGTAMVLRDLMSEGARPPKLVLDLKVGKIPVEFSTDARGNTFGEMHQVDPTFGQLHDPKTVASLIGVRPEDIATDQPIESVSTGLWYAIVPLKSLSALQSIKPDQDKISAYFGPKATLTSFYFVARDAQSAAATMRTRAIFSDGEDPATGSAAGCLIAWMVRHGLAQSGATIHIEQGVEIKRPSQIFARADKAGDKIHNVRVGGNAVQVMRGEYGLGG